MSKRILAIIAALLVGGLVVALIEMLSGLVYPMPEGMNPQDKTAMAAFIAAAPMPAMLLVLLAYFAGALSGAFTGTRIHPATGKRSSSIVCIVFLISTAINMIMIPHPLWMAILALLMWPLGSWLGWKAGLRR